jgi:adenylate cyclase
VRSDSRPLRPDHRRHAGAQSQRRPFIQEDEARLKAFTAQVAISLQSAKLFDDVQNMKNYSESMLQSMSNAVVTLDETDAL